MRKNFGAKSFVFPMPVFILASYDENGIPNAMNAAWGSVADTDKVAVYVAHDHKTTANILARGAYTLSMATAAHVLEADYVGVVSGNDVPDKLSHCGLHIIPSEFVDAPLIEEFPMALECRLISYDPESELMLGEIVNVCADPSILDDAGKIDPEKLDPITFDPVHHTYRRLGDVVGHAFRDGLQLR